MTTTSPLKCEVRDGELRISIGVDTLAFAIARRAEWVDESGPRLTVHDPKRFAELLATEIAASEAEDGSTPLSDLLDEAADGVIETGDDCCTWRETE